MYSFKRLLLVPAIVLLLLAGSVVHTPNAHATSIKPQDFGSCVWYTGPSTTYTNSYGYKIYVRIDYEFDSYSGSCGVMRAVGQIGVPAYRTGGNFTVNLESGGAGVSNSGTAANNSSGSMVWSSLIYTPNANVYCTNGAINSFYGAGGSSATLGQYCHY